MTKSGMRKCLASGADWPSHGQPCAGGIARTRSGSRTSPAATTTSWLGPSTLTHLAAPGPVRRTGGFGLDSLVEIGASAVVLWELSGNGPDRQHRALRLIVTLQSAVVLLAGYTPWHSLLGIAWTAATAALMFTLAAAKPAPAGRGQLSAGHRGAGHARRRAAGHRRAARPRAEHGRRCAVGRPARRPGHRLLRPARSPPTASRWTSGWSAMSSTSARPSAPRATDATAGTCPVSSDVEGLYADWPAHPHRPALNRPVRVRDRGRRAGRAVCQTVGLSPSRQVRWESGAVALLTSTRSTSCGSRARKPAAQAHHPLFLRARGELAC
jgi:hypothetical protein